MDKKFLKNVLSTIAYYDIFDYPLTSFEIWKYLVTADNEEFKNSTKKYSLLDTLQEIEGEEMRKYIEEYRGFYFLCGRKELVEQRIERNKISGRKFKIISRAIFWFHCCPFVRMIAITGRVAMKNSEKGSDLDFLVVLKEGKIFTGRILVTALTHILGKRRYGKKITDRICLNFFLADEHLEINLKDIYSSSEYSFITPVFGQKTFYQFQKSNSWIFNFKPNFFPDSVSNAKMTKDSWIAKTTRRLGEIILKANFIEKNLKKWQMKRIVNDPRTYRKGSGVIAGDEALIFLPDPHGPKVYEKFKRKMEGIRSEGILGS